MSGTIDQATTLIAVAFFVFFVYRQFAVRRVRPWTLVVLPVIVLWGGLQQLHGSLPTAPVELALAFVGLATAVTFGVLRGVALQVWRDADGTIWARGSRLLLALWVASFAARIALAAVGARLGAAEGQAELLLFAAATLGAQNAVLWLRAGSAGAAVAPRLRRA